MHASNSNNWWSRYRRRHIKPRNHLSTEMILRKSFVETVQEYIEHSSLSVIRKIFNKDTWILAKFFWAAMFVVLFGIICYFLIYTWNNTFDKPFVISAESFTYPISDIDFPALALCNINRISKKALKTLTGSTHPKIAHLNISIDDLENLLLDMGRLINFNYKESTSNLRLMAMLSRRENDDETLNVMSMLSPNCDKMLLKCTWGGELVDCDTIFEKRRTSLGHCCVFNYVLAYDAADSPRGTKMPVKRQNVPGPHHGLNVLVDPLLDDYAFTLSPRFGFDVLIFDPIHFADYTGGRVTHRLVEPNYAVFFQMHSIKQSTTEEVRRYPVSTRECRYRDELYEEYHGLYSFSSCLFRCRMHTIKSMCRCTPFFMPSSVVKAKISHTCTLNDLRCLDKYREKFLYFYPNELKNTDGLEQELVDSLYCPKCLPDCEYTKHIIKSYKVSITQESQSVFLHNDFSAGVNISNKCIISLFQPTTGSLSYRLDVVAYWFEILSNIGGFAGMMMGFGIFTAVEIFYFFFFRFSCSFYINYRKYH